MKAILAALLLSASACGQIMFVPVKAEYCGPCRRFSADYGNPITGLRPWIKQRLETYRAIDIQQRPEFSREWKVSTIPTFLLLDQNEKELGRIEGYNSPASFRARLTAKLKQIQTKQTKRRPQIELPECPQIPPQINIDLSPIENKLDRLGSVLAQSQASQESLRQQVTRLQNQNAELLERLEAFESRSIANSQRIKAIEERKRTVILQDNGQEVDREQYGPREAIIFDLQAVTKK